MKPEEKNNRLFSLDALRGLDMLFLCVVQPLVMAWARAFGKMDDNVYPIMRQFRHYWGGFTAYDLIMPLFIFMCGAAVPFALPKRLDAAGRPTAAFWKHIAGRVVLLWLLGMVCQGRLLTCNPANFVWYSNTLQSIAVGYVIAALVLICHRRWLLIASPIILAIVYALLLQFGGDYSKSGNFAMKVDMFFVNLIQPCGHDTKSYTWYLTSLMFGTMTLCGMNATEILRSARKPWTKAGILAAVGGSLWIVGIVLEACGIPCIKQIFTVSFTAQAMGVSMLLFAALYAITDIWRLRHGWWIVTLYGQVALAAYFLGKMFHCVTAEASRAFFGGLAARIGKPWEPVVLMLGVAIVLTYALAVWRKSRRAH